MICAAVAMSLVAGTAAKADQLRINLVMKDYHQSRPDAAVVATLSTALHFRERDVINWARDCGRSVRDVGPAYVISYYTGDSVERVWRDRRGRDWYDYGLDRGVDWDRFNRLDLSDRDFDRMLWMNLSNTAYGCDEPLWDNLSNQGLGFSDLIITLVLGDGHRDRCDYYADQYRNHNRDWGRLWSSADRDSHLWVGYRDSKWRKDWDDRDRNWQNSRDRDRLDQDRATRDRQLRDQQNRDRQDRDRAARDREVRDQQNRDRQQRLDRNRKDEERAATERYNRDRQQKIDQVRQERDRQLRDQQNRDRQQQRDRDRLDQDRANRDRQMRDQQNRDRQDQERSRDRQIKDQQNRDRQQQVDRDRQAKDRSARDKQVKDQQNRDRQNGRDKDRDRSRGDKKDRDRDNSENRGR